MKLRISMVFLAIFSITAITFLFSTVILHLDAPIARPVFPVLSNPRANVNPPSTLRNRASNSFSTHTNTDVSKASSLRLLNGKKIAFGITVTKDGPYLDGAAVVYQSIISVQPGFDYDMIAIIHPGVVTTREPLRKLGYILHEFEQPIYSREIEGKHLRETIDKSGCCGALELLKLRAYELEQYEKVLLLDMDSMLVKNLDHLFIKDKSLVFTWDHAMDGGGRVPPVQGGFLLLKPDKRVYNRLIDIVREGDFRPGTGWGGTHIGWCWGGQTVQGLLAYYYAMVEPSRGLAIDPCAYNSMATTDNCSKIEWENVYSAHFTACQKPWECHKGKKGVCREMHTHWWNLRGELERANGIDITPRCCNDHIYCKSRTYIPLKKVKVRKIN